MPIDIIQMMRIGLSAVRMDLFLNLTNGFAVSIIYHTKIERDQDIMKKNFPKENILLKLSIIPTALLIVYSVEKK